MTAADRIGQTGDIVGTTRGIEWPTVALASGVYLAFACLTWYQASLSWWILVPLGGYVIGLHGSLQHETIHGHPTPWRAVNEAIVFPSLWLWLPYRIYRQSHIIHHRDTDLTIPGIDPESYYLRPADWAAMSHAERFFRTAFNSFLGRLILGPPYVMFRLAKAELARLARGDYSHVAIWLMQLPAAGLVLVWVMGVCGMDFWRYVLCFVYPGMSLTLVRSFAEHRAAVKVSERTALVEAGPVMSLLFLYNNLHALHHVEPGVAWYRLPDRYKLRRAELLVANGGYRFAGYGEIFRRYLVTPKEPPFHPLIDTPAWPRDARP